MKKTPWILHHCLQVIFLFSFSIVCYRGYDQDLNDAKKGRLIIVNAILDVKGANLDYQKPKTLLTALHWAALNNDIKVVKALLKAGATLKFSAMLQSPLSVAGEAQNMRVSTTALSEI
jgi:ankyrin repeat protein